MSEIKRTLEWFQQAMPEPTDMQKVIQLGCHMEEFAEMAHSIDANSLSWEVGHFSNLYKKVHDESVIDGADKLKLIDALSDQIVTAIGVAHTFGLDIESALAEVNRSNFSKFEYGKAVFDENGKITKGKHYSKPDLKPYISNGGSECVNNLGPIVNSVNETEIDCVMFSHPDIGSFVSLGAYEPKMNTDRLEIQSEEQPKPVKVEYVKVDLSLGDFISGFQKGVLFYYQGGGYHQIDTERQAMFHASKDSYFVKQETEITERDEFIDAYVELTKKGMLASVELWAGKVFDELVSGK